MKLTTKKLKQIIREELNKISEMSSRSLYPMGNFEDSRKTIDDWFAGDFKKPKAGKEYQDGHAYNWYLIYAINAALLEAGGNMNEEVRRDAMADIFSYYYGSQAEPTSPVKEKFDEEYHEYLNSIKSAERSKQKDIDTHKRGLYGSSVDPHTGADLSRFPRDWDPMADGD